MSITNKIIDTLIFEDMMSVKQTVESRKSPLDKLKEKVRKLKPESFGYKFLITLNIQISNSCSG